MVSHGLVVFRLKYERPLNCDELKKNLIGIALNLKHDRNFGS